MAYKVSCYLQSLRNQWALSQKELGRLLNNVGHQHVSNLELEKCEPSIHMLFGLEIVFGCHPRDIFVKLFDKVEEDVVRELYNFQQEIEADESPEADRKRQLIGEALSRVVLQGKQQPGYEV